MSKANQDIKALAKSKEVCLWEIAQKLGITDSHFSRKLRVEFKEEEKNKIKKIIQEIYLEKSRYC